MQRLIFVLVLMVLASCTSSPKRVETEPATTPATTGPVPVRCIDCGVVEDVRMVRSTEAGPAKKPALSGIVGGVVSKPATSRPATRYEILIRMLNGKRVLVTQTVLSSGLHIGSKVRVSQGRILAVAP